MFVTANGLMLCAIDDTLTALKNMLKYLEDYRLERARFRVGGEELVVTKAELLGMIKELG